MAQSTTVINAKDCEIQVDDGGALQDISGSSNIVTLNCELAAGEFYTFDGDWRAVFAGKKKWSGSVQACYSETAAEAMDVLWDAWSGAAAVTISIDPSGSGWTWSGEALFTAAPIALDAGDANPILVDFTFEGTGALTKA